MTVNGVSGSGNSMAAGAPGMSQASDPVSKNLQRQIADTQKQLQELSANKDLSSEEKMKKRQELQKKISDLNIQLRQHQIEQRRAKQQEQESFDDMLGAGPGAAKGKAKEQGAGISTASMEAMISADAAMGQAKAQGSVATKMEGRAGVLKAEIALDAARGGDVEAKQAELADVEKTAMNAASAQMNSLAEAGKALENAGKTDESTTEKKKDDEEEKTGEEGREGEADTVGNAAAEDAAAAQIAPVVHYTPVDVRL